MEEIELKEPLIGGGRSAGGDHNHEGSERNSPGAIERLVAMTSLRQRSVRQGADAVRTSQDQNGHDSSVVRGEHSTWINQLRGYNNRALHDDDEWRTGKPREGLCDKLANTFGPKLMRGLILGIICPLLLAGLTATKVSLFALGHAYHRLVHESNLSEHKSEICQLRVAMFWTMLAPIVLQLLWNLLNFINQKCRESKEDEQKAFCCKKRKCGEPLEDVLAPFVDGLLSGLGNILLLLWIIPSQNWVWTSVGMMLIPLFHNIGAFAKRLERFECYNWKREEHDDGSHQGDDDIRGPPANVRLGNIQHQESQQHGQEQRHGHETRSQIKFIMASTSLVLNLIAFILILTESIRNQRDRMKILVIPVTLFGGYHILKARYMRKIAPHAIYADSLKTRYLKACFRLLVEVMGILLFSLLTIENGQPLWLDGGQVTCSLHVFSRSEGTLSNAYMILALVHVLGGIVTIAVAKFASKARMNLVGLCLPLILFWIAFLIFAYFAEGRFPEPFVWRFKGFKVRDLSLAIVISCCVLAWAAQALSSRKIFYESATALTPERSLWYQPFFNTFVLEQSLLYNRCQKPSHETKMNYILPASLEHKTSKPGSVMNFDKLIEVLAEYMQAPSLTVMRKSQRVVLATCMWHEDKFEMQQWVVSLKSVRSSIIESAKNLFISPTGVHSRDRYEAHIVVDGAFEDRSLKSPFRTPNIFVENLFDIIEATFGSHVCFSLLRSQRLTDYGVVLTSDLIPADVRKNAEDYIEGNYDALAKKYASLKNNDEYREKVKDTFTPKLQFYIHLKDPIISQPKKRKNQILYVNFVLGEMEKRKKDREKQEGTCITAKEEPQHRQRLEDTLLVTTDGDTSYTYRDIDALVDSMVRDEEAAGACGRIRPVGTGYMLPYQQFEFASGHWFQKAAEHVLGTVQCCPGCFSIWRMSRLRDILKEYSTVSKDGEEFLRKDLGEDRWMCTLLIRRGWRMAYCAAAVAYPFSPPDFDTFFEQRRRWIASTLINMYDLVLVGPHVAETTSGSGMPKFYQLYIQIMFVLGLLTPSTVMLLIVGALPFHRNDIALFVSSAIPLSFVALVIWQNYRLSYHEKNRRQITIVTLFQSCCQRILSSWNRTTGSDNSITTGDVGNLDDEVRVNVSREFEEERKALLQAIKDEQLLLAKLLTFFYMLLMVGIFVGLILNAITHFWSPNNIFFLSLVGLFLLTMFVHPRDLSLGGAGLIYFLCVPMGYLVLYMYALANMNVMSWGTRQDNPPENNRKRHKIVEDPVTTDIYLSSICSLVHNRSKTLCKAVELYLCDLLGTKTPPTAIEQKDIDNYELKTLLHALEEEGRGKEREKTKREKRYCSNKEDTTTWYMDLSDCHPRTNPVCLVHFRDHIKLTTAKKLAPVVRQNLVEKVLVYSVQSMMQRLPEENNEKFLHAEHLFGLTGEGTFAHVLQMVVGRLDELLEKKDISRDVDARLLDDYRPETIDKALKQLDEDYPPLHESPTNMDCAINPLCAIKPLGRGWKTMKLKDLLHDGLEEGSYETVVMLLTNETQQEHELLHKKKSNANPGCTTVNLSEFIRKRKRSFLSLALRCFLRNRTSHLVVPDIEETEVSDYHENRLTEKLEVLSRRENIRFSYPDADLLVGAEARTNPVCIIEVAGKLTLATVHNLSEAIIKTDKPIYVCSSIQAMERLKGEDYFMQYNNIDPSDTRERKFPNFLYNCFDEVQRAEQALTHSLEKYFEFLAESCSPLIVEKELLDAARNYEISSFVAASDDSSAPPNHKISCVKDLLKMHADSKSKRSYVLEGNTNVDSMDMKNDPPCIVEYENEIVWMKASELRCQIKRIAKRKRLQSKESNNGTHCATQEDGKAHGPHLSNHGSEDICHGEYKAYEDHGEHNTADKTRKNRRSTFNYEGHNTYHGQNHVEEYISSPSNDNGIDESIQAEDIDLEDLSDTWPERVYVVEDDDVYIDLYSNVDDDNEGSKASYHENFGSILERRWKDSKEDTNLFPDSLKEYLGLVNSFTIQESSDFTNHLCSEKDWRGFDSKEILHKVESINDYVNAPSEQICVLEQGTIASLLKEVFGKRRECLNEQDGYGQNIKDHVVKTLGDYEPVEKAYRKHNPKAQAYKLANDQVKPPDSYDKLQKKIKKDLEQVRREWCLWVLCLNGIWILTVFIVSLYPEIRVRKTNVAGLAFFVISGLMLSIQLLAMLKHRLDSFIIFVSYLFPCEKSLHGWVMACFDKLTTKKKQHRRNQNGSPGLCRFQNASPDLSHSVNASTDDFSARGGDRAHRKPHRSNRLRVKSLVRSGSCGNSSNNVPVQAELSRASTT